MIRRCVGYVLIAVPWAWLMDGVMLLQNYESFWVRRLVMALGTVFIGVGIELARGKSPPPTAI